MNKNIIALMSMVFVFALVATPAFASEVDFTFENTVTGADSDNNNDGDVDDTTTEVVTNVGTVSNSAAASVNTGNNDQDENTEAGDIETGAVDASTDWETVINESASLMAAADSGLMVSFEGTNDTTGADSDNDNDLDVDTTTTLSLVNSAYVLNSLGLSADTGNNEQEKNTSGGMIATGDVGVWFAATNEANNDGGFAGASFGSTEVNYMAKNHKTGADSDNNNDVDVDNNTTAVVTNNATLSNQVSVAANTGNNTQKKNTQAGDIQTGAVDVSVDVTNEANNGGGFASANGSDLEVSVEATNSTTGADSDNDNDVDVTNNTTAVVTNVATVANDVSVSADTGNNEQEKNTEGGSVETGDVSIDFSASTTVNSN